MQKNEIKLMKLVKLSTEGTKCLSILPHESTHCDFAVKLSTEQRKEYTLKYISFISAFIAVEIFFSVKWKAILSLTKISFGSNKLLTILKQKIKKKMTP